MSDPLWLLEREATRFARERATIRGWWRDRAGTRIDGRYLGEHEEEASDTAVSLREQAEAAHAADAATEQVDEAVGSANDAVDRTEHSLGRAAEEVRTAREHAQQATQLGQQADQTLQAALELVGRAGAPCGETTTPAAHLRTGLRETLPGDDERLRELLEGGAHAAEALGEPIEAVAHRVAGDLAGTAVGAGAAAVQLGAAMQPLLSRGSEGMAMRRLARREVTRARTKLLRRLGR